MRVVTLSGHGLHSGREARLALQADEGATVRFASGGASYALSSLEVIDTRRATTIAGGGARFATVEHLTAALAGLGIQRGVTVVFEEGDEVPILDGCSLAFVDALSKLDLPRSPPSLRVVREAELSIGVSRFRFSPRNTASVAVEVAFGDPRLVESTEWDGTSDAFVSDIASARTFAFADEVQSFVDAGLARHVAPTSVVVLTKDEVLHAGRPFSASEPVRHKMLDLVGDLFLYGGPPLGRVEAYRPGHASTHAIVARALEEGILERLNDR